MLAPPCATQRILQLPDFQYALCDGAKSDEVRKKVNEARKAADPDPKAEYPTPYWTEIVRIMSTQKAVTSEAVNALGEKVEMRICSKPTEQATEIYSML